MMDCTCTSYFNLEVFAYQHPTIWANDLFILHVVGVLLHVVGVLLRVLLEVDLASLEWM